MSILLKIINGNFKMSLLISQPLLKKIFLVYTWKNSDSHKLLIGIISVLFIWYEIRKLEKHLWSMVIP